MEESTAADDVRGKKGHYGNGGNVQGDVALWDKGC